MAKFRKKPLEIEAEQATKAGCIKTPEGLMSYSAGDWIITGIHGERYPCKDAIFRKTYDPVEETDGR